MKPRSSLPEPEALGKELALVAIGCSAGGFDSLQKLLPSLPADFPVPVVVVIHLPPDKDSFLPRAFHRRAKLEVKEAEDKESLLPGFVYFAPPGYHLLVEKDGTFSLTLEDPVHFSRPSIDVLLESVAAAYGRRALGLVLSGANADGANGLELMLDAGGYGIVEDPATAAYSAMPSAAFTQAQPQQAMPIAELAKWLGRIGPRR